MAAVGASVEAIYWTKGERFVAVNASPEANAFLDVMRPGVGTRRAAPGRSNRGAVSFGR